MKSYSQLINEVSCHLALAPKLSTYSDADSWDKHAESLLAEISYAQGFLYQSIRDLRDKGDAAKAERMKKFFLIRLFPSSEETALSSQIRQLESTGVTLSQRSEELGDWVDFTPNSSEDKAALLKQLKMEKKELSLQKKEVLAEMRGIRAEAKDKTAAVFAFTKDGERQKRRSIRFEKEAALRPHESAKEALERQILQVDRRILWAEKFRE